jgi:hypothetical protein
MVKLSTKELLGIWDYLRGPVWGGDILSIDELWTTFDFDNRFKNIGTSSTDFSTLSDELIDFDLSSPAVQILQNILKRPGQQRLIGRASAAALKRMDNEK